MKTAAPIVRPLESGDCEAWLEIAAEVEPLFGPMVDSPEFRQGIQACIDSGEAYGVEHGAREIAGIVAMSRTSNEIVWLAVKKNQRGRGYGALLVEKAVALLEKQGEIHVQTFASDSPEGAGARAIYRRYGFVDHRDGGLNPAGIPTVIMVRKPA